MSKTQVFTSLTNFKSDSLKYSRTCYCGCYGLAYSIQFMRKEKIISEIVAPGFDNGNIIDWISSSRIKLHPV